MYEDIIFAKPKPYVRTSNASEALSVAENLHVDVHPFYLRDIKMNNDGTLTYGNNTNKITKHGFEKLLKVLGIPINYARQIPRDLLFTTIVRLQKDKGGTEVAVLSRSNGDVAGVVKTPYDELSYEDVIGGFMEMNGIRYFTISEERLSICLTFEELEVKGLSNKDSLFVGTFVYSSILKDTSLVMSSGLYRSQCTNSFIMPAIGRARAHYLIEEHSQRLLRFIDNVRCYDTSVLAMLTNRFTSTFQVRKLFDDEVAKYWQNLNKVIGQTDADKLIKMEEEERKNLLVQVKERNTYNKRARLLNESIEEHIPTNILAYDVINDITSFSQKLTDITEVFQLDKLGGSIIQSLILN